MGCLLERIKQRKPNYTAAVTHGLSKAVRNKPSKQKRKGPSTSCRAEIESIVNPFYSVDTTDIPSDVTARSFTKFKEYGLWYDRK